MELAFLSPSPMELAVIAVIALLVLGPSRLPEAARSLGKGMKEMRDSFSGAMENSDNDRAHLDEDDDDLDEDVDDDAEFVAPGDEIDAEPESASAEPESAEPESASAEDDSAEQAGEPAVKSS